MLTTKRGFALIVYGNAVGFFFALAALSLSVVSFPLLLDRPATLAVGREARSPDHALGVDRLVGEER